MMTSVASLAALLLLLVASFDNTVVGVRAEDDGVGDENELVGTGALASSLELTSSVKGEAVATTIQLRDVLRGIDMTTSLTRFKTTLLVVNNGATAQNHIYYTISKALLPSLSLVVATSSKGAALAVQRLDAGVTGGNNDFVYFKIVLPEALKASASIKIVVRETHIGLQEPYPASISQSETQLVRFSDNVYFASPYVAQTQKTVLRLASATVESYSTQVQPVARKGQTITYGPYEDVAPFSAAPLKVHFENNSPFLKASRAIKEVEVSHWGNVAIEHKFVMQHSGARLKGSFSRYEYQRNPMAAKSAVRGFRLVAPEGSRDFYYRDEIGNISTSAVAYTDKGVALHLVPRYVLFGGWRAAFCLGYNVPSQYVLSRDAAEPDLYMLNVTFYARYKEAVPTEEYELVVTLPEGASDIQVHAPFALDSDAPSLKFTYLDTVGRPVVRVRKHNVVYDHDQYVQVTYRFSQQYMLHEPLLLCVVFFCLLLAVIVYSRVNLSLAAISGARENAARAATRGAECVARLRDVLERRDRLHNALDAASTKLAKTRNKALWEAERQAVQDGWDECKREALRLAGELEVLDTHKGAVARQVDAAERLRQKAHMNVALHEALARQSGTPDAAHEAKRLELERALQEADDQVERLAASLVDE